MESFTFSINWPRAKCIVLVGEDDILFCFLIFFQACFLLSRVPHSPTTEMLMAELQLTRRVSKHSGCPGPHGIFSIFKLCNEVQGLRFWGTMIRRPGWDHDWGCRLGTISGGHFLPFPQGWGVIFLEGCYGLTIGIKPTSADRLGAKCGGGMAFIKQNQLI